MNFAAVEKIANAVLYEGYMLYPYRPSSTKNVQRWNFGTLYPRDFAQAQSPPEQFRMRSECLIEASSSPELEVHVRFLQLARKSGESAGWEQGFERSSITRGLRLDDLLRTQVSVINLAFPAAETADGCDSSSLYLQQPMEGRLTIRVQELSPRTFKLVLELENTTSALKMEQSSRADALLQSFSSAHMLLGTIGGQFVSLLDPPLEFRGEVALCTNVGSFPVLVGDPGERNMMLASPIILYDYPQIAPESDGDFFDGTEMDEMLALRVMTMTEAEKEEMRSSDARARMILARTETLPQEHFMKVHGAVRGLRRIQEQEPERKEGR